ncbi:Uncharacterized protein Fot_32821 [Forsythia ovata]|uniref:Uncharacterized protein n=1 Tax=Forsythia ovata TaxID=205694 RepID=A0ABD1T8W5_9LAMI
MAIYFSNSSASFKLALKGLEVCFAAFAGFSPSLFRPSASEFAEAQKLLQQLPPELGSATVRPATSDSTVSKPLIFSPSPLSICDLQPTQSPVNQPHSRLQIRGQWTRSSNCPRRSFNLSVSPSLSPAV